MYGMDRWDWVLFALAVYVAVVVLVRLMTGHRDKLVAHLRQQVQQEQRRKTRADNDAAPERGDEAA